jgi:hypothetical protein
MTAKLKKSFIKLLEEDKDFRYTVAGYLGLSEILKRLDSVETNIQKLWEEVRDMRVTLNRVATTLDRLTISVEEEALSVIRHRLKTDLGVEIRLSRLFIDSREVDVYGAAEELCVVCEATVRMGTGLVDELLDKIAFIKVRRPELLRPRIIKAIYTDYATPDALEYAMGKGVWVLNWSGDLTPLKIEQS